MSQPDDLGANVKNGVIGRLSRMFGVRAGRATSEVAVESTQETGSVPSDCLFCARERPDLNTILAQNDTCYARYDNFPATDGHVEIVPKRHVESFFDLTPDELRDAYALLRAARDQLGAKHGPDGWTVGVNEGRAAGRTIDHLHIHLIPRRFGDVEDPRGGIRQVVPNCHPSLWASGEIVGHRTEVVETGSECADAKR